jgi:hypothetical protein
MDIKEELTFLSPSPLKIGEGEVLYLTVFQVLTFIQRQSGAGLEGFLIEQHGMATPDLVDFYNVSCHLLTLPEDHEGEKKTSFGGDPERKDLTITPNLLAVAKVSNQSLKEVLEMSIAHYNLCLRYLREISEAEKKAYEESKRRK